VLEVDVARKRIALSMKMGAPASRAGSAGENRFQGAKRTSHDKSAAITPAMNAMSSAFSKLKESAS